MARWQFLLADAAGANPTLELTRALSRKLTVRLTGTSEASCTLDGTSEQAQAVNELATDLLVWRDGQPLHRGRIGATSDDLSADGHTVQLAAPDYRALLDRRMWLTDTTHTAEDPTAIAWAAIAYTQAQTGGNLGITDHSTPVGTTVDYTAAAGETIRKTIDTLAQGGEQDTGAGFDWDITPDLTFTTWGKRGVEQQFTLDWGGNVLAVKRSVDPSAYANAVRASGSSGLTAEYREAPDLATRPEGRFDSQVGLPDITGQQLLSGAADRLLADLLPDAETVNPSYTVTLRPDRWTPDDLWVGDTTLLVIRSGRLDVVATCRVTELDCTVGDDGSETITVTLGVASPATRYLARFANVDRRLSTLERR